MKKIETWFAFDGASFNSEEKCREYENDNPLSRISFYINGRKVEEITDETLMSATAFVVYDFNSLLSYRRYCINNNLFAPDLPDTRLYSNFDKGLHFIMDCRTWLCLEEYKMNYENGMKQFNC